MSRATRVKFCGITRATDRDQAVALAVDALGFVFDARSLRAVTAPQAAALAADLPRAVQTVALFRDASAEYVRQVLQIFLPTMLQFHGNEPADFCAQFGLPYLKAVPMATAQNLENWLRRYAHARALLLDAHAPGELGGTGQSFDWTAVPHKPQMPIVLAGGLRPENVAQAITIARPCAVDVSSGIESAPGIKDPQKMQRFMQEVRRADAERI